jgi:hypothetical protein
MADNQQNAVLNQLLIDLSHCLLQYVGECWPWTVADSDQWQAIAETVTIQKRSIGSLVDLLDRRRQPVEFGTYPTEFTNLQYLAIKHLLGQLIDDERALVNVLEQTTQACAGNGEAGDVVEQILAGEREILNQLRTLAAPHPPDSAS